MTNTMINAQIVKFLNGKLTKLNPNDSIFVSIGDACGMIRIRSNDQGGLIPACWNIMGELDHFLMELLDSDILDIKTHLHCNQYDPEGNEFFTFFIVFEYDC